MLTQHCAFFVPIFLFLQKADLKNLGSVEPTIGRKVIERRRSIILAIVAQTFPESPALKKLLSFGFLHYMNSWLIDSMKMNLGMCILDKFSAQKCFTLSPMLL
jgi:hypothetical protein